jgi:hypothetical protein
MVPIEGLTDQDTPLLLEPLTDAENVMVSEGPNTTLVGETATTIEDWMFKLTEASVLLTPIAWAIAFTVFEAATVTGPEYRTDAVVGIEPSMV